jgi:hypothetical protein
MTNRIVHKHVLLLLSFLLVGTFALTSRAAQPQGAMNAAIQTSSGNFVTAVNGGGIGGTNPIDTDRTQANSWETFTVVWLDPAFTKFALRTQSGNFVTAVNGGGIGDPKNVLPIHSDATAIGAWEKFNFNFLPNNQVTISTLSGKFLTAVNGGGMGDLKNALPIHTDATKQQSLEVFTLVPLYNFIDIKIATGGDDARADSSVTAGIISGPVAVAPGASPNVVQTITLKPQSAPDQNGNTSWNNWTSSDQHFALSTPTPACGGGGLIITLTSHNSFGETNDNWNLQGILVTLYNQSGNQVAQQAGVVRMGDMSGIASGGSPLFRLPPNATLGFRCP